MEEQLQQRITAVTQQLQQVNATVLALTENLAQAKASSSQLQGHLNEANYMLDEYRKFESASKETQDVHLITENNVKLEDLHYQEN